MKSSTIFLTMGIAAVLAIALAPSLTPDASAVKTVQPEECTQDTGGANLGERCPGESGGNNPNRQQEECAVTGGGGQTVQGQQKKICD